MRTAPCTIIAILSSLVFVGPGGDFDGPGGGGPFGN